MGADQHFDLRAVASVLDWWVEAGVDTLIDDAPRDWLATPPAPPPAPAVAPASTADIPGDWAGFAAWRSSAAAPEERWSGDWIAAAGPETAPLMVLADCPNRDDAAADAGGLMAGEPGRLFDRMLAAIGLDRAAVHLASLCAKRPTAGRILPADEARLTVIARHHIALVRPRAVLLLGNATSRAILATDLVAARGRPHRLDHNGVATVAIASYHPRFLLDRPAAKPGAWSDLRTVRRCLGE